MSAPAKERERERGRARVKTRAKKKAKTRRGLGTIAVRKDTLHECAQRLKGKERARIGSRRNSGRGTILASSRSSGTTGGQEARKAMAKAQTNLMEKEVCPSQDRKVCLTLHSRVA